MDSAEVGKYIESVAVRIGFHDGGSLAGTGVLYTLQTQNRAVVLTAGHVLQRALANAFRDGEIKTVGTDIDKLMPPVSRFGGGGRAQKKQGVIDKLKSFFDKFFGIGGSSFEEGKHD